MRYGDLPKTNINQRKRSVGEDFFWLNYKGNSFKSVLKSTYYRATSEESAA